MFFSRTESVVNIFFSMRELSESLRMFWKEQPRDFRSVLGAESLGLALERLETTRSTLWLKKHDELSIKRNFVLEVVRVAGCEGVAVVRETGGTHRRVFPVGTLHHHRGANE